jgi:hypothetical protein
MCFYRISKHKRSDSPIPTTVYKVMRKIGHDCVNSVYYPSIQPYSVGETIKAWRPADTELMDIAFTLDGEIVHAYQTLEGAEDGIRAICHFHDNWCHYMLTIVQCEIPPGVEYWLGSDGEIGARELRIVYIIDGGATHQKKED